MRWSMALMAAGLVLVVLTGCASFDPNAQVSLTITSEDALNTYTEGGREGPHSLDLYVFKVDDPDAFMGNDAAALRVIKADVIGGRGIGRWAIGPGQKDLRADLGKMREERWTHIGIFAAFGSPEDAPDAQKRVIAITGDYALKLTLGARRIESFTNE